MFGPLLNQLPLCGAAKEKIDQPINVCVGKFYGNLFGYAAYYFVRANFDLAQKGVN